MKQLIDRINNIDGELNRRHNQPLYKYNRTKVHAKQMQFHQCTNKNNRWVFGGNRSGKTECGAVETVWLARGIHPYRENKPVSCWVVSLSNQVQRDVAQQKILHYIEKSWIVEIVMLSGRRDSPSNGIIDYIVINNVLGSTSKIAFKSCEAGREKFQGTSLDFVWFDEEPPYDIYQECCMRILDRAGHVFGTMTPLKGSTWVYDTIYLNSGGNDDVWYIFMQWADNPYLPKKQVELMTATMSSDELESRRYGKFGANSGLVYDSFDSNVHVIEPFAIPPSWQDTLSIDPGLHNPLSCHWYCVDNDGTVYVVAEHYMAQQDINYHSKAILDICDKLNWKRDNYNRVTALMDSAANQHTLASSSSVSQLFYENGIVANTRVNKDMYYGINIVKGYLMPASGKPRLFIFSSCVNLIREIKGYRWANNDKPVKVDDHAMDELRYYLASRPKPSVNEVEVSQVARDKMRLASQLKRSAKRF